MTEKTDVVNTFTPVTDMERIQLGQLQRLDALCNMMSSFIEAYANEHNIATEGVMDEQILPTATSSKSTKAKTTATRKPRATKPKE